MYVLPYAAEAPDSSPDRASARKRFGIGERAFCAGFVGRLDPCKDVPFLLKAFADIQPDEHDRILVVGTGPDEERLRRIGAEVGVARHIVWAGRMESPPNDAYAAMDVLVLPSVYQAFGLVLVEAMAAGVPAIARADDGDTVFTASAELVPAGCGFVVDAAGSADLTKALRALKDDPERAAQMGQRARAAVLQRGWDDFARRYLYLLRDARRDRLGVGTGIAQT